MKRLLVLLMCFNIVLAPTYVFAGAAEKWEIVENFYDNTDQKVNITARKISQDAANSGVYKVKVPVNPNTLGSTAMRMLWGGVAVGAITALVEGVGWVIDEGSKTIKREKPVDPSELPNTPMIYQAWSGGSVTNPILFSYGSSPENACNNWFIYLKGKGINQEQGNTTTSSCRKKDGSLSGLVSYVPNPNYQPDLPVSEPEYEYMTPDQLGNEILGQGENTAPSPTIITDAYSPNNPITDAPAPKESNDALDSANPQPETDTTGETKPKPNVDTDGDGVPDSYDPAQPDAGQDFTLPAACDWFPAACDFFKVQKQDNKEIKQNQKDQLQQDKTFFEKVEEWFDWSQNDTDLPDDESPQISQLPIPELEENAISWSAQCPNDVDIPINLQGVSSTITFSWSPWCQLLSIIKPAIVASAYIGAAFIVLGLRT